MLSQLIAPHGFNPGEARAKSPGERVTQVFIAVENNDGASG
ncbi:TPA: hypothetical protein ACGSNH_001946 [Escherichia coli]